MSQRKRVVWMAVAGLVAAWLSAWGGYSYFTGAKVTEQKVAAYMRSVDLSTLAGAKRKAALDKLARQINALPPDERRRARLDGEWQRWFDAMTEEEKAQFIEATMPSGFKQMISAFEQMPAGKRQRAVEEALRGLSKARQEINSENPSAADLSRSNRMGELSPELQQKVITLGLNSFYSESSAQTKAELAPVMEEMQRLMERGALLRGRR